MPRNYQPKNILTTDRTNLEKAFYHRVETGCSIRTACELFDVKGSTLGVSLHKSKPSLILSYGLRCPIALNLQNFNKLNQINKFSLLFNDNLELNQLGGTLCH